MKTNSLTRESAPSEIQREKIIHQDNEPKSKIENTHKSYTEFSWQQQFKDSISNIEVLCKALELQPSQLVFSSNANKQFPLRVPWSYVQRMQKANPNDPLLLQVLPHQLEEKQVSGFHSDPVGDLSSVISPGMLQKYHGRVLLLATSRCAIHCRYCFRRHFPYSSQNPRFDIWQSAIKQIAADKSINEVILSGGDPLVIDDDELAKLVTQLESIPHIKRLRLHTRLPVVIPARITRKLLDWIGNTSFKTIMVLHINHPNELNNEVHQRLQLLKENNCLLLNQSVLMKNINDNAESLIQLSESLFDNEILPYYLHLLDKVQGSAHFEVSETQARKLMRDVAASLPGYLVPKLTKEEHGANSKTWLAF